MIVLDTTDRWGLIALTFTVDGETDTFAPVDATSAHDVVQGVCDWAASADRPWVGFDLQGEFVILQTGGMRMLLWSMTPYAMTVVDPDALLGLADHAPEDGVLSSGEAELPGTWWPQPDSKSFLLDAEPVLAAGHASGTGAALAGGVVQTGKRQPRMLPLATVVHARRLQHVLASARHPRALWVYGTTNWIELMPSWSRWALGAATVTENGGGIYNCNLQLLGGPT